MEFAEETPVSVLKEERVFSERKTVYFHTKISDYEEEEILFVQIRGFKDQADDFWIFMERDGSFLRLKDQEGILRVK